MNDSVTLIESLKSIPSEAFPWVAMILLILLFIGLVFTFIKPKVGKIKNAFSSIAGTNITNEQLMLKLNTIANNHLHDLPEVVDALRRQEILLTQANEKLTAIDKGVAVLNTKIDALR